MKIMFFAHDPGGANAVLPLIKRFDGAVVFGKGPALHILPDVSPLEHDISAIKPDFIITGTSANDFTERELWIRAAELNIPTMAILDAWINYGVRFSRYGTKDLHLFDGKCEYFPRYICVMDELAKSDMAADGVPSEIILPFGNPHFEHLFQSVTEYPATKNNLVLFASQPFDDVYRTGVEITALEDLLRATEQYADMKVIIRKHPKESADKFQKYMSDRVEIDNTSDIMLSINRASIIVSVNSMVLIEALFLGKKIISYQPKTKDGENDFILTRNGTLPFINEYTQFSKYFDEVLNNPRYHINNPIPHIGIIERIVDFIKEHVNV